MKDILNTHTVYIYHNTVIEAVNLTYFAKEITPIPIPSLLEKK